MTPKSSTPIQATEHDIVLTRVYEAPVALVYEAFVDDKHISNWWGPRGFTTTTHSKDVRVGGFWRFVMHGPDGTDYPNLIHYLDVVPNKLLVYEHGDGNPEIPPHFHGHITFEELAPRQTRVTLRLILQSAEQREHLTKFGAVEGGQQTLLRLAEHLMAMDATTDPHDFVIVREFNAPRERVFAAWTDADQIKKWWAPRGMSLPEAAMDARVGGAWRVLMRANNGAEFLLQGVIRELAPPERLVLTDERGIVGADGCPPIKSLVTVTLDTLGERRTRLTVHMRFETTEGREMMLASGMRQGYAQSLDTLDSLLRG